MHPFVRGRGAGLETPVSAAGVSKAQEAGKAGHRSELQRRPDAGPSAYALLRAWSALRNPGFLRPSPLRLSEPLHSHLQPRVPASHERMHQNPQSSILLTTPSKEFRSINAGITPCRDTQNPAA